MSEEQNKKLRHQEFWNAPSIKLIGDPSIKHTRWNPHENKEIKIEND